VFSQARKLTLFYAQFKALVVPSVSVAPIFLLNYQKMQALLSV
jgi:hypothetical protein